MRIIDNTNNKIKKINRLINLSPSIYTYLYKRIIEEINIMKLINKPDIQSISNITSILTEFTLTIVHSIKYPYLKIFINILNLKKIPLLKIIKKK